jgi:hypothetical protein
VHIIVRNVRDKNYEFAIQGLLHTIDSAGSYFKVSVLAQDARARLSVENRQRVNHAEKGATIAVDMEFTH